MQIYKEVEELRDIILAHKQLRVKKLVSPLDRPDSLLGMNGVHYLLKLLERSLDLLEDIVAALESKRTLSVYLLVRAHFETTSNLGFFLSKLQGLYINQIERSKVEEILGRLSVGGRKKPDWHKESPLPDPIHINEALRATDKLLRARGSSIDMFMGSYDQISEYSHPNYLGISYMTEVNLEEGSVVFLGPDDTFDKHGLSALMKILISANIFMHYYKEALGLLEKNETMPTLIK